MSGGPFYLDPSKRFSFVDVTLKGGTTVSDVVDLQNFQLRGFYIPAGGFAGAIKFNALAPGPRFVPKGKSDGTYLPVQTIAGVDVSFTLAAGKYMLITDETAKDIITALSALRYIQLTYADPGADKVITLVLVASLN